MKFKVQYIFIICILCLLAGPTSAQHHKSKHKKQPTETVGCPLIDSIIDFSKTKLGCAYRSGGTGPNSFDCSGFVYYVFGHFNIQLGRSSRDQILMGQKVDRNDIRPGDLVFWYRGKGYVGHAGMVVEVDSNHNFKFIHSATHGKGVRYDYSTSNWYTSTYAGARRIIDCDCNGQAYLVKADGRSSTEVAIQTRPEPVDTTAVNQGAPSGNVKQEVRTETQQVVSYHKVKSGETLSTIARKHHVSVNQLKQWNHLKSDMIRDGAKLKIIKKETRQVVVNVVQKEVQKEDTSITKVDSKKDEVEKPEPKSSATSTTAVNQEVSHIIQRGETLSAIARKYNVSVDQIKQWNNLKSDMIHEGDRLRIVKKETQSVATTSVDDSKTTEVKAETPKPETPQPKVIYHKIKQGETLSTIARKYHVTVNQIKQWNHLKSDMIREDAKLKIIK